MVHHARLTTMENRFATVRKGSTVQDARIFPPIHARICNATMVDANFLGRTMSRITTIQVADAMTAGKDSFAICQIAKDTV